MILASVVLFPGFGRSDRIYTTGNNAGSRSSRAAALPCAGLILHDTEPTLLVDRDVGSGDFGLRRSTSIMDGVQHTPPVSLH